MFPGCVLYGSVALNNEVKMRTYLFFNPPGMDCVRKLVVFCFKNFNILGDVSDIMLLKRTFGFEIVFMKTYRWRIQIYHVKLCL